MLVLKSNDQLKKVFLSLIKTLGVNVTWNSLFVVTNNTLILTGKVRSLFFNFDTKKLYTNLIDLPIESSQVTEIINDDLLVNAINMTLYAFGKWGSIPTLKVEKNYAQLNQLFKAILKEVTIEPSFRDDNFRFYKNKILISYEDVIAEILSRNDTNNTSSDSDETIDTSTDKSIKESNDKLNLETSKANNRGTNNDIGQINKNDLNNSDNTNNSNNLNSSNNNRWKTAVTDEEYDDDYKLGLWHNMKWLKKTASFTKIEQLKEDKDTRLGNSFYPVGYKCPICGEPLYISLYPVGKEFPIETEEGKVYLARAYTCNTCNCFYTPRPEKLLQEGDIYSLEFDEDRVAYEDYLELLGNAGERCANYNFNQFASQYNKNKKTPPKTLDELMSNVDMMSEDELEKLENKIKDGFYPQTAVETFSPHIKEKLLERKTERKKGLRKTLVGKLGANQEKTLNSDSENLKQNQHESEYISSINAKQMQGKLNQNKTNNAVETPNGLSVGNSVENSSENTLESSSKSTTSTPTGNKKNYDFSNKSPDELKYLLSKLNDSHGNGKENSDSSNNLNNLADSETLAKMQAIKEQLNQKLKEKFDAHIAVVTRMSPKQLSDLKAKIESEETLSKEEKEPYLSKINKILFEEKEQSLKKKAEACKGKSYNEIERVTKEIEESDLPDSTKRPLLESLKEEKKKSGEKEVEYLMSTLPPQLNKRQFDSFLAKLQQYKEVDISPYEKQLTERRSLVEQQEITSFINRANKNSRDSLWNLYNELKEQGFSEKNLQPFLDKIHNKIYKMDEEKIQKICPSIAMLSFEDALDAVKKIQAGAFLPELKVNTLELLDKRLTKLKVDECDQLVRKLEREIKPYIKDDPRFHFYQARKAMRDDLEEDEKNFFDKVLNAYATGRGQYEYPILVADSSRFSNGKEGFILTPDHIFYNGLFHDGVIPILEIDAIEEKTGLINKGVFVQKENGEKVKLPLTLPSKEWKGFAKALDEFVGYLQEKPESRNVAYLAKEKHEKKCCYRCGYVYTGGNVCPKCGSKANN